MRNQVPGTREVLNLKYIQKAIWRHEKQLISGKPLEGSIVLKESTSPPSYFYNEGFEAGVIPTEWVDNDVTYPWDISTEQVLDGAYSLKSSNLSGINNASSSIVLRKDVGVSGLTVLSFDFYNQSEGGGVWDRLFISVNGVVLFQSNSSDVWDKGEVLLAGLTGVQDIEFRISTDGGGTTNPTQVSVDNVKFHVSTGLSVFSNSILLNPSFPNGFETKSIKLIGEITRPTSLGNIYIGNGTHDDGTSTRMGWDSYLNPGDTHTGVKYNTVFGSRGLKYVTDGIGNVAMGTSIMGHANSTNPINNVGVGRTALHQCNGAYNIGVGFEAGRDVTTDTNLTILGANADRIGGPFVNSSAIGYNAQIRKSNQIVLGDANVEEVTLVKNGAGISMKSPNGTEYLITVNDAGALVVTPV